MGVYQTNVQWAGGHTVRVAAEGRPDQELMPPPDFGGDGKHWTPEELLVGSVESCLLLTVLYFVDKFGIGLESYQSRCEGRMEQGSDGLRYHQFEVFIEARVASEADIKKMESAIEKGKNYCPVSRVVNVPIHLHIQVQTA